MFFVYTEVIYRDFLIISDSQKNGFDIYIFLEWEVMSFIQANGLKVISLNLCVCDFCVGSLLGKTNTSIHKGQCEIKQTM